MNNTLRGNALILGLLPAIVASLILAAAFLWQSQTTAQKALDTYGQRLALQIAPMQEYPLFAGNTELLENQLQSTLQLEKDLVRIEVIRRDYTRAAMFERGHGKTARIYKYRAPVLASYSGIEDYAGLLSNEIDPNIQVLGWVEIALSDDKLQRDLIQRYSWLAISLLVAFIVAYVLGKRLTDHIAEPIEQLLHTSQQLERGKYSQHSEHLSEGQQEKIEPVRFSSIWELAKLQRALIRLERVLRHREQENRAAIKALSEAQYQPPPAESHTDKPPS